MKSEPRAAGLADLETVDRVARAAHLWVRHNVSAGQVHPASGAANTRYPLAAGVISGLCEVFELDSRCSLLAAYAYALLDGESDQVMGVAYSLARLPRDSGSRTAFNAGRAMAVDMIAVLKQNDSDQVTAMRPSRH